MMSIKQLARRFFVLAPLMMTLVSCGGGGSSVRFNQAPVISAPANVTISANVVSDPITITVTDDGGAANVNLSVASENLAIIDNTGLELQGSGENRTLTITALADVLGTSTITLEAVDGGGLTVQATVTIDVTAQQISFSESFRQIFLDAQNPTPIDLNSRVFVQDGDEGTFDDLLVVP